MQKLQGGYTYYFNVKNGRSDRFFRDLQSAPFNNEGYFNRSLIYK